jgi:hypothetical protein
MIVFDALLGETDSLGTDMKVLAAPIVIADNCPFFVGDYRCRRMSSALSTRCVLAQMWIRLTVRRCRLTIGQWPPEFAVATA